MTKGTTSLLILLIVKIRSQTSEDRNQTSEDRRQKTKIRRQKSVGRSQYLINDLYN
jgi:hypothetical protein